MLTTNPSHAYLRKYLHMYMYSPFNWASLWLLIRHVQLFYGLTCISLACHLLQQTTMFTHFVLIYTYILYTCIIWIFIDSLTLWFGFLLSFRCYIYHATDNGAHFLVYMHMFMLTNIFLRFCYLCVCCLLVCHEVSSLVCLSGFPSFNCQSTQQLA